MKHYKLPGTVSEDLWNYGVDEAKLTEQDCVNEVGHELEVMQSWEAEGWERDQYGDDYGKIKRQFTLYLTRQRKRGITPNHDYRYLDDPAKKL